MAPYHQTSYRLLLAQRYQKKLGISSPQPTQNHHEDVLNRLKQPWNQSQKAKTPSLLFYNPLNLGPMNLLFWVHQLMMIYLIHLWRSRRWIQRTSTWYSSSRYTNTFNELHEKLLNFEVTTTSSPSLHILATANPTHRQFLPSNYLSKQQHKTSNNTTNNNFLPQ